MGNNNGNGNVPRTSLTTAVSRLQIMLRNVIGAAVWAVVCVKKYVYEYVSNYYEYRLIVRLNTISNYISAG